VGEDLRAVRRVACREAVAACTEEGRVVDDAPALPVALDRSDALHASLGGGLAVVAAPPRREATAARLVEVQPRAQLARDQRL